MISQSKAHNQASLFQSRLDQILNPNHYLFQLAHKVDWKSLESDFSVYYSDKGRPAVSIRTMVGLLIIKHICDESDESLIQKWCENPYWQYFTGESLFQHQPPCDPSLLAQFRNRVGPAGAERILQLSIQCCQAEIPESNQPNETEVLVDTTVQPKNITYPTDAKLHCKISEYVRKIAKKEGIKLRQSYVRLQKAHLRIANSRPSVKNSKAIKASRKRLRTYAGRLVREIERLLPPERMVIYAPRLEICKQILSQSKNTKNKVYSLHEPEVSCITKGKANPKFEFGNIVSVITGSRHGIIMGMASFTGNIHDSKTLDPAMSQFNKLNGYLPDIVIADRGYKGAKVSGVKVLTPSRPTNVMSHSEKQKQRKRFRKRAGIEPIIGHLKSDHRMRRNFLKGVNGDAINALLAAAAFNFRKWARMAFLYPFWVLIRVITEHLITLNRYYLEVSNPKRFCSSTLA